MINITKNSKRKYSCVDVSRRSRITSKYFHIFSLILCGFRSSFQFRKSLVGKIPCRSAFIGQGHYPFNY
ncbi:hypothetical protein BpHYR1_033120 [Brachionus plicatilis]|uniref:Uncharacterized protein n=1 Tax=Brachionus plicatilis TaxID=10195 RepID=A0A3M7PNB2_BRAPC|nr:hypothetical protein BpHYR1_033120 [Brachionus plicatilis]